MWECPKCKKSLSDDGLNICWRCGTDRRHYVANESSIKLESDTVDDITSTMVETDIWTCQKCGEQVGDELQICWNCGVNKKGEMLEGSDLDYFEQSKVGEDKSGKGSGLFFTLIGGIFGAIIGYIFRPSIPLIGQLPLDAVITRGTSLRGFDQILISVAKESFNYLLIGTVGGGFLGYLANMFKSNKNESSENNHDIMHKRDTLRGVAKVNAIEIGQTPEEVEVILGKPNKIAQIKTKTIYVYRDMKVTFMQGKVDDVD